MKITIVGGGNIGTQFAVHCAEKAHDVVLYGSQPEKIEKKLFVVDEKNQTIHEGNIQYATSDAKMAFESADVIFVTMPAFCMDNIAEKILPYARIGMKIGLIPGTGGGECAFKACIEKGCIVFGLQRVPSVARLVQYGKSVCAIGYRKELHAAALPHCHTEDCCKFISDIFDMPCIALPNYLNLTLTPSNPILHTTRLRVLFKDYSEGKIYDKVPLFYENWDDESSELLIACDNEVQKICQNLKEFDLLCVKSLKEHYESSTAEQLTAKISSIDSFKGLTTPTKDKGKGVIPDFASRYFTADFSYGLVIIKQIADMFGIEVKNIEETLEWYHNLVEENSFFNYEKYGICNRKEFLTFYNL